MKRRRPAGMHVPAGFRFAAASAGLKASGRRDLALAEMPAGAAAAALFTTNRVVAVPVEVGRARLAAGRGRLRAVIVNSGNANCATGPAGRRACLDVCRQVAHLLRIPVREVFPSSTGIIGVALPAQKIVRALPALMRARGSAPSSALAFARALMTTDTRSKVASANIRRGRARVRLLGVAKGSGMIHPRMATMLAYVFTDVAASPAELHALLREAAEETFNAIAVDGDTSTNDTVLLMASGASGVRLRQVRAPFRAALLEVCRSLAEQIVRDGEGARHVVRLRVEQARTRAQAQQVARAIALSPLVKTAWAGADPNWGRILSAIGASGAAVRPARIDILFGKQCVCRKGSAVGFDRAAAHRYLSQPAYDVTVRLGLGRARAGFLTCDLTAGYVRINAGYST